METRTPGCGGLLEIGTEDTETGLGL
ncbi:hypothetical protein PROAA_2290015 [Candidatus Propionivibrio aalborgensis]|uniref:Uncharacterized protein n=1 Tax=Candidatus Propionivibrio aalborgensis TaxID=1860101 RepID=A0A1A8XR75_9RHOO|nr:hypothetical protein PROAA_2290015 [Candidatus Propionivibrio aalborgensis]